MSRTAWYLVRRFAWYLDYGGLLIHSHSSQGYHCDGSGPRYDPVALYPTESRATAEAHRRNVEARQGRNPFWFAETLTDLTDSTLEEAASRLVRKGLPPPPPRHPEERDEHDYLWRTCESWRAWWDRESVNWTAEQLADAWAVFPKLRFYDVVEIELED